MSAQGKIAHLQQRPSQKTRVSVNASKHSMHLQNAHLDSRFILSMEIFGFVVEFCYNLRSFKVNWGLLKLGDISKDIFSVEQTLDLQ